MDARIKASTTKLDAAAGKRTNGYGRTGLRQTGKAEPASKPSGLKSRACCLFVASTRVGYAG